jgi:hypothetical protein
MWGSRLWTFSIENEWKLRCFLGEFEVYWCIVVTFIFVDVARLLLLCLRLPKSLIVILPWAIPTARLTLRNMRVCFCIFSLVKLSRLVQKMRKILSILNHWNFLILELIFKDKIFKVLHQNYPLPVSLLSGKNVLSSKGRTKRGETS